MQDIIDVEKVVYHTVLVVPFTVLNILLTAERYLFTVLDILTSTETINIVHALIYEQFQLEPNTKNCLAENQI